MPLGESRFDVCKRVQFVINEIIENQRSQGIEDYIIVSHGVTLRVFGKNIKPKIEIKINKK